jgi:hypothetical protein
MGTDKRFKTYKHSPPPHLVPRAHPSPCLHLVDGINGSSPYNGQALKFWGNPCILYGVQVETHEHLFFQCPYTSSVWSEVARRTRITWPPLNWQNLLQWAAATLKSTKTFAYNLAKSILSTTVYFIWYECNNKIFHHVYKSVQRLRDEIFQLVRTCLLERDQNEIPSHFKYIWSLPDN